MYTDMSNNDKKPAKRNRGLWRFFVIIVFIALIGGGVFLFFTLQKNGQSDAEIATQVEKHIILPDEDPTITTVEQTDDLVSQPFFANVKTGDKILIYPKAARIIVYRPAENILVNVGPIIDDSTPTDTNSSSNSTSD